MSEKTLKFGDVEVNKKEFHASKQPIALDLAHTNQIVTSDKSERSDKDSKYFICYKDDDIIRPLCIVLPQMSGYIKYFYNSGKDMSFKIEDDSVLIKYNEIWNKIKEKQGMKFHSKPVYNEKYIKTKVKTFNVINTIFSDNKIPKESGHYACIEAINIDSVIKIDKKNYPQNYIEEWKYKIKKIKMVKFNDLELDLDDSDDSSNSE